MSTADVGSILEGKYEILERLAKGGMGEVFLVRHVHLEEKRVVKILRRDLATDPGAQKRFLREARLATQIKHPNVAILFDYTKLPEGSFFMVWEHIDGTDVGSWLGQQGVFPLPTALHLGIQALRGLEAIHSVGVIHRDISPDNLMITRDRKDRLHLKIIDLGLAKNLTPDPNFEITEAGMFMGKLRYCAPEQAEPAKSGSVDHRCDLYSLALVLYEMISGLSPFEGDSPHDMIFKRLKEDPVPLAGRRPDLEVPEAVDRVLLRALEREPERRYDDAVTFIEDLETLVRAYAGSGAAAVQRREIRRRPAVDAKLSSRERAALLEQIDSAARRARETSRTQDLALQALEEGRLDEVRRLIEVLETRRPKPRGLSALKRRLRQAEEMEGRRRRLAEAEQMVERYVRERRPVLARMALDVLLEMYPNHPRRDDFQSWVELLARELEDHRQSEMTFAAGRAALLQGELDGARAKLEELRRTDADEELVRRLSRELRQAEEAARTGNEAERRRQRFEDLLTEGRLDDAESALEGLARLGVPKVTLDLCRNRLEQARSQSEAQAWIDLFERRYIEKVAARDWLGAREVVHAYEKAVSHSPRPAEMFAEVSRLEEAHRREQALVDGVQQLQEFIREQDLEGAEMALRVLLQIEPRHPRREEFERQIQALKG